MNLPSANTTDILFVHSLLVKCGTCKRQLAELKTVMTCKSQPPPIQWELITGLEPKAVFYLIYITEDSTNAKY